MNCSRRPVVVRAAVAEANSQQVGLELELGVVHRETANMVVVVLVTERV